ncbi:MAG: transglutaminase family protein [Pseudomonadota bacterium]|nr:transglutaminase family protein [Pseudomonadota bacterium]
MIRLDFSIELNYEIFDHASDFIFNFHAAPTAHQRVVSESLTINQDIASRLFVAADTGSRFLRLQAQRGALLVRYAAVVEIEHVVSVPEQLQEMAIADVPSSALQFIYPSRYCQSDRLYKLAGREFGHLPRGYARVMAIQEWIRHRTAFTSNTSNSSTSALDTIIEQVGVCRDFAHLMIALCRASNIPARFVTGIDYGANPRLGPIDFHAYVEVMLSGRWYVFDPSGVSPPMGLVRLGTGRDAADVAFATVFGAISSQPPVITIEPIVDVERGWQLPFHTDAALSTAET